MLNRLKQAIMETTNLEVMIYIIHFKNQILIFLRKVLVIQLGDFGFELLRFVGNFSRSKETA